MECDRISYFSIKDFAKANDYYTHPILRTRLTEICEVLLHIEFDDAGSVFGFTDALKVRCCMALFKYAVLDEAVFQKVPDNFYHGIEDRKTLEMLEI